MPRKKTMGRAANGNGTIRKKTVTRNGTEYTYWEARCTVGYDPWMWTTGPIRNRLK